MVISEEAEKKVETYKLPCSLCRGKKEFKVVSISRKSGIKVECLSCGKTMHKNLKYLEGKKN